MAPYRTLIFSLSVLVISQTQAQDAVRITNIAALSRSVDLSTDKAALAGMQAAGIDEARVQQAIKLSGTVQLPDGIRTDSARTANLATAANYSAQLFCSYAVEEGTMVIVQLRAMDNIHMPEHMRSSSDLYLTLPEAAVEATLTDAERPKPSKGPAYSSMPKARITRPDGVYATYDLGSDKEGLAQLEKRGLSGPEIDAVIFRSQERNWPDGIDSFVERYPQLQKFKKYKAFRAAKWDGKVLLVIPAEANKKLPPRLRPYLDIYMVYEEQAVAVAGKK